MSYIGAKIKKARKTAGLTQQQLAEKTGYATITIQQYERGVREPKLEAIRTIAVALDTYVSELVDSDFWLTLSPEEKVYAFNPDRAELLDAYDNLNSTGQTVALERIRELGKIPEYQKDQDEE